MVYFADSIFRSTTENVNQAVNNFVYWISNSSIIVKKFGKIEQLQHKKNQSPKQLTKKLRKIVKISKKIL